MITYINDIGKAYVEHYDLYGFLQECGQLAANGYTLCVENEYFCRNIGGNYLAYYDEPAYLDNKVEKHGKAVELITDVPFSDESLRVLEDSGQISPETVAAVLEKIANAGIGADEVPSDANPVGLNEDDKFDILGEIAEAGGVGRIPKSEKAETPPAAEAQTEVQEETPRRRGRPPRN